MKQSYNTISVCVEIYCAFRVYANSSISFREDGDTFAPLISKRLNYLKPFYVLKPALKSVGLISFSGFMNVYTRVGKFKFQNIFNCIIASVKFLISTRFDDFVTEPSLPRKSSTSYNATPTPCTTPLYDILYQCSCIA